MEKENIYACFARFFGIIIRLYFQMSEHNPPHIHAIYGDNEIVIVLDGEVLEGSFPSRQRKMLEGWMAIHEDELKANDSILR